MRNLILVNLVLLILVAVGLWMLPLYMTAPIIHSPWFRSILSLFDPDTRVVIIDNDYPWSSIGFVQGPPEDDFLCSGYLIAPNKIVTSAHCVLGDDMEPLASLYYGVVRHTNYAITKHKAVKVRTGFDGREPGTDVTYGVPFDVDIAFIDIGDSIGHQVGFFKVEFGSDETPEDPEGPTSRNSTDTDLCVDTVNTLPWRSPAGDDGAAIESWTAPDPQDPPRICAAGYSGDLGYARLSVANDCGLLALHDGLVYHDCYIASGASGGPLFYMDEAGRPVAFAVNTAIVTSQELRDIYGTEDLFVGTLLEPFLRGRQAPTEPGR